MKEFVSKSIEDTKRIGELLGKKCKEGMVFLLNGNLGAGKTCFTQGIARGLNISKNVNSPTFNILKIYEGRLTLNHIDAYRLEGLTQDLGFEEQIDDNGLTVIEWSQYIKYLIPNDYLEININIKDDYRIITLIPHGNIYELLLEEI